MKEIYLEETIRILSKEEVDELLRTGKVCKTEEGINYIKIEEDEASV